MNRPIPLALLLLPLSAVALAGEAQTSRSFAVPGDFAKTAEWYPGNRAGIFKASNCRILKEQSDGTFLVVSKTPVGDWKYAVRETMTVSESKVVIRIDLADKLQTSIKEQVIQITIEPAKSGSKVTMSMDQNIDNSLVPGFALKASQRSSIAGAESFLKANTPK
jgi:hypothetical protein